MEQETLHETPSLEANRLLRIPLEIRLEIYSRVFTSARFTCGSRQPTAFVRFYIAPSKNNLALLLTCRQIRHEIGDSWIGQVLFNFEHPCALLEKLTPLSLPTLKKIRHVRVRADEIKIRVPATGRAEYYPLVSILKLLPGLCLDQLTVLCSQIPHISYGTLDGLIADGTGWNQLRYISHDSLVLGCNKPRSQPSEDDKSLQRPEPQPCYWQGVLESRDGEASVPSVTIYRCESKGRCIFEDDSRRRYQSKSPINDDQEAYPVQEEWKRMVSKIEPTREIMVIARRGHGVDYEEKAGSAFIAKDIRQDMPDMTWQQIRPVWYPKLQRNIMENGFCKSGGLAVVDTYNSVDDYVWTDADQFGIPCTWKNA